VEFAISAILAIIVCHDATGVRRETGKHAEVLNELLKSLETGEPVDLKELVGHTPVQVFAGILIGIGNACLMYYAIL
jgi:acid phosphatase family membrane protein YuiD